MANSISAIFDELRIIGQNGLEYADDPYDRERYERIVELVSTYYGNLTELSPEELHPQFKERIGHVTPNIGAGAAIVNDCEQILLLKRADDGTWAIPGGYSNPGETPPETAVRETNEDTGLKVEPVELVAFQYREPDRSNPHGLVGAIYQCHVTDGDIEQSHESESIQYKYIDQVSEWHEDHEQLARQSIDNLVSI